MSLIFRLDGPRKSKINGHGTFFLLLSYISRFYSNIVLSLSRSVKMSDFDAMLRPVLYVDS